jgi:hypothetical protein
LLLVSSLPFPWKQAGAGIYVAQTDRGSEYGG